MHTFVRFNCLVLSLVFFCLCKTYAAVDDAGVDAVAQPLKVPASEFTDSIGMAIAGVREVVSALSQFQNFIGDFRLENAVSDCLDLLDMSADQLSWSEFASQNPPASKINASGDLGSDLRTWLSAALTNQDTCKEGLDGTSNGIAKTVVGTSISQVYSLIQDLLTMVQPEPKLGPQTTARASPRRSDSGRFPAWVPLHDRHLLESTDFKPDAVVAQDGTGNFTKVMDAVTNAPSHSAKRYVIHVKKGVYREYVEIKKSKPLIMLVGDGIKATVISGNRSYGSGWTTYRSATFAVSGWGFIARDMTFENTAGPEMHQAVALRSDSDLSVFYRCAMRGYQDTLYAHAMRQFFRDCKISGTVDFIFGDASAVFQSCEILSRRGLPDQKNTVTAHGRKASDEPTAFSIQFCNITADGDLFPYINSTGTYLGRPWRNHSRTVVMQSYIGSAVRPEGWLEWNGDVGLDTLFYGEYLNYGPGAATGQRVKWPGFHVMNSSTEADNFTVSRLIVGDLWLPATGVKYSSGLKLKTTTLFKFNSVVALFLALVCLCKLYVNAAEDIVVDANVVQTLKVPVSEFTDITGIAVEGIRQLVSALSQQFEDYAGDIRLEGAVSDCLDLLDNSIDLLSWSRFVAQNPPGYCKINCTGDLGSDLRTWFTAALTNQDTCMEGLEETSNGAAKTAVGTGIAKVYPLIQNLLTMIRLEPVPRPQTMARASRARSDHGRFPMWVSSQDRHWLESPDIKPDVVVAQDGTGNFKTVLEAVSNAPSYSTKRYVIHVKKGLYREYVEINKSKQMIMMFGDGIDATVISGNRSYVDKWTTLRSATFGVSGGGFIARDMTFENTAGPEMHQAVALRSDSDLSVFYRCAMRGYQDTLYLHANRQFFRDCKITGTVDFIFGFAAVVLQRCEILARLGLPNQTNTVTAHGGRFSHNKPAAFSIQYSSISADRDLLPHVNSTATYLGRPWRNHSRTVVMQSYIGLAVRREGWLGFEGNERLDTVFYGEYKNHGPGAETAQRVKWPGFHMMNASEAHNFTVSQLIDGDSWLPHTGVRYDSGLEVM